MDEHAWMCEEWIHASPIRDRDGSRFEGVCEEDKHREEEGQDSRDYAAGVGKTGLVQPGGEGKGHGGCYCECHGQE